MVSVLAHAVLALVAFDTLAPLTGTPGRTVEILLDSAPASGGLKVPARIAPAPRASQSRAPAAARVRPQRRRQAAGAVRAPVPGNPVDRPEGPWTDGESPPEEQAAAAESVTLPEGQIGVEGSDDGGQGSAGGGMSISWAEGGRRVLKAPRLKFPRVLAAAGQEVDGEARITVTPSGVVSRVEITRRSGYTEVDASVEANLRGYLFSPLYGYDKRTASGVVKYHFRLGGSE
jgi:TonB family protein